MWHKSKHTHSQIKLCNCHVGLLKNIPCLKLLYLPEQACSSFTVVLHIEGRSSAKNWEPEKQRQQLLVMMLLDVANKAAKQDTVLLLCSIKKGRVLIWGFLLHYLYLIVSLLCYKNCTKISPHLKNIRKTLRNQILDKSIYYTSMFLDDKILLFNCIHSLTAERVNYFMLS